jgi:hypothetical protein
MQHDHVPIEQNDEYNHNHQRYDSDDDEEENNNNEEEVEVDHQERDGLYRTTTTTTTTITTTTTEPIVTTTTTSAAGQYCGSTVVPTCNYLGPWYEKRMLIFLGVVTIDPQCVGRLLCCVVPLRIVVSSHFVCWLLLFSLSLSLSLPVCVVNFHTDVVIPYSVFYWP